jgi:hypothetical protein
LPSFLEQRGAVHHQVCGFCAAFQTWVIKLCARKHGRKMKEEEQDVVLYVYRKYPNISKEQLDLLSLLNTNAENFRVVSEVQMFQGGRFYVEIRFNYDSKYYKGNLKIDIE